MWRWATVVGLSMTPALILGQSAAVAAGLGFGFAAGPLIVVIAIAGFVEGLIVLGLSVAALRIDRWERLLARWHTPRVVAWLRRWGTWGGLLLGPAAVGQEPVIIGLVWMDVPARRLIVPLAISNVLYTLVYYAIVKAGWALLF